MMYLGLKENGEIHSWASVPVEGYAQVNESDLPDSYLEGFGQRRWLFIDGQFVERENWLAEWNEAVRITAEHRAEEARLEEERRLALEATPE